MADYKLIDAQRVRRITGGLTIPFDPQNAEYQEYLSWVGAGNTPDPADPPAVAYTGQVVRTNRIRTTDATSTEVVRITLAPLTAYVSLAELMAVDAGNGNVRYIRATLVAKRLAGGALLVGTPVVIANHQDAGAAAWTITPSVAGNDFVTIVTGAAGRSIDWSVRLTMDSFTPGGA